MFNRFYNLLFVFVIGVYSLKGQIVMTSQSNLTVDTYTRNPVSIKLQNGFKYGFVTTPVASNLLNLSIGTNPTFVGSFYAGSAINPLNSVNCDNQLLSSYKVTPNTNKPVGALAASFNVTSSGAAIYNIPIQISPGTSGMQPDISVQYNNQSGNGILGEHFNLTGISMISRTPKTPLSDGNLEGIKLNATDVFALNGNRMFGLSGTYGQNGATYYLEVEDFSTLTSYATGVNPDYFIVKDKSGNTIEFGNSLDSKHTDVNDNVVLSWYINKLTDEFGNYIQYKYKKLAGELVVDKIEYTGNVAASLLPYNTISFDYFTAADNNTYYISGKEFRNTLLLKSIICNSENTFFKKYNFNYIWKNQSCLSKVTEVLSDGTELNPTEFCWEDPAVYNNIYGPTNAYNSAVTYVNDVNTNIGVSAVTPCDFNGDGYSDPLYYYAGNDKYKPFTNGGPTGTGTSFIKNFETPTLYPSSAPKYLTSAVLDVNQDGRQEVRNLISTNNTSYRVDDIVLNPSANGTYFNNFSVTTYANYTLSNPYDPDFKPTQFFYDKLDFTGDGNLDEVRIDPSGIYFNSSLGPATYPISTASTIARPIDFDGDGNAEFIVLDHSNPLQIVVKVLYKSNVGAPLQINQVYTKTISFTNTFGKNLLRHITLGDFNGDGKTDLCYLNGSLNGMFIEYSDGTQFLPPKQISSFLSLPNYSYYLIDVFSCDINADGKSDIVITDNTTPLAMYQTYFSIGNNLISGGSISGVWGSVDYYSYAGRASFSPGRGKDRTDFFVAADYNGDGRIDAYSYNDPVQNALFYNKINGKANQLITTIYVPTFEKISVNYGNAGVLDCQVPTAVASSQLVDKIYSQENLATFSGDMVKRKLNIYCVNRYTHVKGDLRYSKKYLYTNAICHTKGRGFLGFERVIGIDPVTLIGSQTISEFDATYYIPVQKENQISKFNINFAAGIVNSTTLISKNTFVTTFVPRYTKGFYVSINEVNSRNYLNSTQQKNVVVYDLTKNGSIQSVSKTSGWSPTINNTESVNFTYASVNGYFKPLTSNMIVTQTGEPTYNRQTNYQYDAFGHLTNIINDPTFGQQMLTTTYSNFDLYGNATNICTSAGDVPIRCNAIEYEAKGRYIIKKTDALGNISEYKYENLYCNLIEAKDISGLITKYSYDGHGRLIKTISPNGAIDKTSYNWSLNTPFVNTAYAVITENEGQPIVKHFFGHSDKIVREESQAFNGKTVYKDYTYNTSNSAEIGALIEESENYFSSNQPIHLITKYSYEPTFFRVSKREIIKSPSTSIGMYVNYTYNLPSTDALYNKGYSKQEDNLGKSTSAENNGAKQVDKIINYDGALTQNAIFAYSSNGQKKNITVSNSASPSQNIVTSFGYNNLGQKTSIVDPSSGTTIFTYNTIGALKQQSKSTGVVDYYYDVLGRLTSKTGNISGTTTYQYVTAAMGRGQLDKVFGPNSTCEYKYDQLNRLIESKETIGLKVLKTNYAYDKYGNLVDYTYPSGFKTQNIYDNIGTLIQIKSSTNQSIWQLNDEDALGISNQYTLGNGLIHILNKDDLHYPTDFNNVFRSQKYATNIYNGNEIERRLDNNISATALMEQFTYDGLDRLTKTQEFLVNGSNISPTSNINNINYNALGNIISKDDAGNPYQYSNSGNPYLLTNINNPSPNLSSNTLNFAYTDFEKVSQISEMVTNKQMDFTYGCNNERIKVDYKINSINQYTRYYAENYDRQETASGYKEWNYIYAPSGLTAVYYNNNGSSQLLYITADNLGSPVLLTDQNQQIVEEYSFDAWGRRRNPTNWSYTGFNAPQYLNRGYTFHEHIDEFGLINMNGRIYDPVVGRFMQPDIYITYPQNIQNYNRYAYALNNPLKFTDPDGNNPLVVTAVIGALFGGYSGYQIGKANGATGWGLFGYTAAGAVIGAGAGLLGGIVGGSSIAFANTMSIFVSSFAVGVGNKVAFGEQSPDFVASFGAASYNGDTKQWGYLGKPGNNGLQNLGYTFGALGNVQDAVAGFNGADVEITSRKKLWGHSEGSSDGNGCVSVYPKAGEYDDNIEPQSKWEWQFFEKQMKGRAANGENGSLINPQDKHITTITHNVNKNLWAKYSRRLDDGSNLLGTNRLIYGAGFGCVNNTSRALLYSGVINFNAFLPLTPPLFLNFELALRQAGMLNSAYLISAGK